MILVCEPVCRGFEHAAVNAAMLLVIKQAWPDEEIVFLAEAGHLGFVAAYPHVRVCDGLSFETLETVARTLSSAERFGLEYRLVNDIFAHAEGTNASRVVFSCISDETLRAGKILLDQHPRLRCLMVMHGILASAAKRPSVFPWKNRNTFRTWLLRDNSDRLTYLVLGDSIKMELLARFPSLAPYVASIDHPYHFESRIDYLPFREGAITFGSLGVLRKVKGSHEFLRLAREVGQLKTAYHPKFVCIGPIVSKKLRKELTGDVVLPSPDAPLSSGEFAAHVRSIDYAVFFHKPETYALTASGVLFDAFSYLKPVITLRSPFSTYYFERMGNIGYLCESYDDLKRTVLKLLNSPPREEYEAQRQNMLKGREELEIPALAQWLRNMLEPVGA